VKSAYSNLKSRTCSANHWSYFAVIYLLRIGKLQSLQKAAILGRMDYKTLFVATFLLSNILLVSAVGGGSCDSPSSVSITAGTTFPLDLASELVNTTIDSVATWTAYIRGNEDTGSNCNSAVSAGGVYWYKLTTTVQKTLYLSLTWAETSTTNFDALYVVAEGPATCPAAEATSYPGTFKCLVNAAKPTDNICQGYPSNQPATFVAEVGKSYFVAVMKKKNGDASPGTNFTLRIDESGSLLSETFEAGALPAGKLFLESKSNNLQAGLRAKLPIPRVGCLVLLLPLTQSTSLLLMIVHLSERLLVST
jgi:hypothetical protein